MLKQNACRVLPLLESVDSADSSTARRKTFTSRPIAWRRINYSLVFTDNQKRRAAREYNRPLSPPILPIPDVNYFGSDKCGVANDGTDLCDTIFIHYCSNNTDTSVDSPLDAVSGAAFCLFLLNRKREFFRSNMFGNYSRKFDVNSRNVLWTGAPAWCLIAIKKI